MKRRANCVISVKSLRVDELKKITKFDFSKVLKMKDVQSMSNLLNAASTTTATSTASSSNTGGGRSNSSRSTWW